MDPVPGTKRRVGPPSTARRLRNLERVERRIPPSGTVNRPLSIPNRLLGPVARRRGRGSVRTGRGLAPLRGLQHRVGSLYAQVRPFASRGSVTSSAAVTNRAR